MLDPVEEEEFVSPITAGVFVSGFLPAFPARTDAVLCLCQPAEMVHARRYGYPDPLTCGGLKDYAWRPIEDDFRAVPSLEWLDATARLVCDWRAAGRTVLVHCAAGISRSPTVAAAYLMRKYRWPAADALAFVKKARPVIDPNGGLVALLSRYETLLAA